MNTNTPICLAPWNSILVDTDKKIKPCCAFNQYLGNLNDNTLKEITSGPLWTEVKNQLANQEWPEGCMGCKRDEERMGWSVRQSFYKNKTFNNCTSDEIVYLELDGSNICNLGCLHCSPLYSSKWLSEWNELETQITFLDRYKNQGATKFSVNPEQILNNLKDFDLSKLGYVVFKGGDPMLNDETLAALRYFDELSLLSNMEINIFTNGTIVNKEILSYLNKAKNVRFTVSIDGIGKLNEYIRYGKGTNSEDLRKNIEIFGSSIKNFQILLSISTMIYNVFSLVEIRDFWLELRKKYNSMIPFFNIVVINPAYLDPKILPNDVRSKLIEYYKQHQQIDEFEIVIKHLSGEYLGDQIHNQWVEYTEKMEKMRGNSIAEIVPELKEFLYYK